MIRPLRRRHRRVTGFLAIALPVAFVAALASRSPTPRVAVLPAFAQDEGPGAILWERDDLWGPLRVVTWIERDGNGIGVGLRPLVDLERPEVLAYWVPSATNGGGKIPGDAVLLGPVAGTTACRFPLPGPGGSLLLYSLGHAEIVGTAELPEDAPWA